MPTTKIIGILNVTPDSYHDGGKYQDIDAAVKRAGELLEQGADFIEVGGESTGPKSVDVSEAEELKRVIPVIKAIRKQHPEAKIAIDTYKAAVAAAAAEQGIAMINDVTAGRADPTMFAVAATAQVPLVLMYSKDSTPRTIIEATQYDDVITTIKDFLKQRKAAAIEAGVDESNIILDPGMGHYISSDPQYSFQVLARLREFEELGSPLYISASRKSFLAGSENLKTVDRLPGTIAASAVAVMNGATYIRTHDVVEVRRGCEIAEHLKNVSNISL